MNPDPFSFSSYYVENSFEGKFYINGTCFFVKHNKETFLITNWHIVTGKSPIDGSPIAYHDVSPDLLTVKIYKNHEQVENVELEIKLQDSEGNPVWKEHPVFGKKVDVVAIKVSIPDDKIIYHMEDFMEPFNEDTKVRVNGDVIVLGFPFGISVANIFPIWKRASIASEPDVNIDNLPKMYIDTASRPGMSGSPVIYKEKRPNALGVMGIGTSYNFIKFIGVYSGRIGAESEKEAQLGIVWKYSVIDEIIKQ